MKMNSAYSFNPATFYLHHPTSNVPIELSLMRFCLIRNESGLQEKDRSISLLGLSRGDDVKFYQQDTLYNRKV